MTEHRFSIATAIATFLLLLVGGLVHATGSSLACPDWPLCYGQLFPDMKGGVLIEHSHRLLATSVGLMTIILAVLLWRIRPLDARLRRLGLLAVALVSIQGVLGGITVKLRLPLLVSTAHLATSMVFFSLVLLIAFLTRPARPRQRSERLASLSPWALGGAGVVYLQIILGAFVRHTGSGLACNTSILTCRGTLWPTGPETGPAQLHVAHRIFAIVTAIVVFAVALRIRNRAASEGRGSLSVLALAGPVFVILQILIGIVTVKSFISVPIVEAHLGVGVLLLAQQVSVFFLCRSEKMCSRPEPNDPKNSLFGTIKTLEAQP